MGDCGIGEEVGGRGERERVPGGGAGMKVKGFRLRVQRRLERAEDGGVGTGAGEESGEEDEEDCRQISRYPVWAEEVTFQVLQGLAGNGRNLRILDLVGCASAVTDEIVTALAP
eukprot:jgi/Mesvir1/15062/Mv14712-RA.1